MASKPLVLVVDDEKKHRDEKKTMLELGDFVVISAASRKEAEKELRASPSIDLLMTDVNLVAHTGDISGVELARRVRDIRPELPVIGYSGRFAEGDLPAEDREVFHKIHLKGNEGVSQMLKSMDQWREMALEHRQARSDRAAHELERLRTDYDISSSDFELLREFVPAYQDDLREGPDPSVSVVNGKHLDRTVEAPAVQGGESGGNRAGTSSSGESRDEPETIGNILKRAGFRLRLVDNPDVPDSVASEGVKIAYPIPIWLQYADDCVVAEVYGFDMLYAHGLTEESAVENLLALMAGFRADLAGGHEPGDGRDLAEIKDYLERVFG